MMIKRHIFLLIALVSIFEFHTNLRSHAYFTDTAVSSVNTFVAASNFGETEEDLPATPSAGIVINEVFESNTNKAEWVEIYNPTEKVINLKNWSVTDNLSKDTLSTQTLLLPPQAYAVIITNNTEVKNIPDTAVIIRVDDNIGNGLSNKGDRLVLKDSFGNIIDAMSYGDDKIIFENPPAPTSAKTLQRIPNGFDSDSASDWKLSTPTLGVENQ